MMSLQEFFLENPRAAIGLSGGVDSTYLLYAGLQYGADIQPYFIKTAFQPAFELEDARRICAELGVELKVIGLDVLAQAQVAAQTQINADLADAVENSDDPDRQADIARGKLGLVEPGERVFYFTN